ncbi:MAG: UvrD-helicase domain-containing protein, partial [Bacteroidetes bacterium]|nr:UvrD-helicase domain-containing protein [Bacteroidota bacterium]
EIIDFLKEKRLVIIQSYIQIKKNESILEALLPLKVNKDIQDELSKIETENDLVFLSKFNTLIKENLKDEPSAFIYEKIGTKFQHFFFDEFQDTSLMQWQNFVPLRDHTISMEDTSFTVVGDPKQSIYRFRGGDSQLMLSLINKTEKSPLAAHTKVLKYNWRSANNIVKFNNELYQYQSQFLEEQHQKIFSEDAQQIPKNKTLEGRVKINLLENSSQPEFFENLANAMHNNIQDCLEHGFSMSDITILCRGNKDILRLSQLLGYKKVIYKGKSSFIKTISEKGLTLNLSYTLKALISFLTWKTNTQNKRNLVDTLYWLQQLGRVKFHDFSSEVFSLLALQHDGLILEKLSNKYALNLQDSHLPQLNLYNFVEYFLKEFCVPEKETDFVLSFLEILHGFGQNVGLGLKDFLQYWNDEGRETSIAASENVDAVQLMTIHKAKGLEFPIVFFALRNDNDKEGKFSAWLQQDDEILPSVYLPNFSSELTNYDEELKEFNDFHTYENRMDNLCVQYVATTRPVEQLYLYLEKPGKDGISKIELYDFVKQYNVNNEEQFDLYPGDYNKQKKEKNSNLQHHKIVSVFPMDSQKISKITIATPSKTYQFRNDKVRQGILMHEILSKIKYPNDLKFVLKEYSLNGILTASEIKILKKELKKVIANNESYFSEKYTVINEREILISNKDGISLHRPDRLLMDIDGNCTIIDFKTGTEKTEHQRQVEKYKLVLEKIGYRVVETKIIYTQQT